MRSEAPTLRRPRGPSRWRGRLAEVAVVAVPLVVGGVGGGLVTAASIPTWYRTLAKPDWNPPAAVFGPVWTTLYLLMGVALLQVWRLDRTRPEVRVALALFGLQLALNLGWSWIFFGRREVGLALAEIVALHLAIVATTVAFWRLRPRAALLLAPYLAWVTVAVVLNAEIWRLNR